MLLQTNPLGSLFSSARSPLGQFIFNRPPDFEDSPQPAARAAAPASSAHAASRPQGGIGGALSRLFGGDFDSRVSEDVNARAGNQGLIASGLATLLSDREGLGAIAEGIVTGQSVGQAVRGEARAEQEAQIAEQERLAHLARINEAFGDGMDRQSISQALRMSIAQGDATTARVLTDVLREFPAEEPADDSLKLANVQGFGTFLIDPDGNLFDPFTKKPVTDPPEIPEEEGNPFEGSFTDTIIDPDTGRKIRVRFSQAGQVLRVLGFTEASEAEKTGDLAGMARQLDENINILSRILDEKGAPPNEIQERLANRLRPAWVQEYEAAAGNVNIDASRLMFGARVSDSEREALSAVMTPRAGDKPSTIKQKMDNLRRLVEDFKAQEGIFDPDRQEGESMSRYGVSSDDGVLGELATFGGR